jgi:hypothetical protein
MDDELEKIWKGAVVAQSRYYFNICLEGLREPRTALVGITGVPAEYETRTSTMLTRSVGHFKLYMITYF